ncbi:MAG TPA: molybdopterin-dependent oxidoreductase [Verrucomicrobiales bacterium]|nr:molybdopterin-dependent oxidoreductase [Verrucomicrobiales bacterium]
MKEAHTRREFLKQAAMAAGAGVGLLGESGRAETVTLPFENGVRTLAKYPQKRPMIVLTARPPQLETPFSVFNEGILTPNDAFFVRYHLANIPLSIDATAHRLTVKGLVERELTLSPAELKAQFETVEITAVNQCSGNSRGFFQPRVGGGQLGNGAMGNAKWKGARLKDILDKAGVKAGAKQVVCDGLDRAVLPDTPDFIKALEIDLARSPDVLVAWEMNGEPLPMLNGFPLRLVVPGYFGTYWIKHLSSLTITPDAFSGFFMSTAYRIPANAGGCVEPGATPASTVPITKFKIRSFLTSHAEGAAVKAGDAIKLRGIAFDSGEGITEVQVSTDGGKSWVGAELGKDLGRYSFREWTHTWKPDASVKSHALKCRAFNRIGETQPLEPLWNPAGYLRNVVETVNVVTAA